MIPLVYGKGVSKSGKYKPLEFWVADWVVSICAKSEFKFLTAKIKNILPEQKLFKSASLYRVTDQELTDERNAKAAPMAKNFIRNKFIMN